ncbi:MAG: decarboxylating NADP(+)-dependent phosphogluconate dehydrogenase [Acidimicrobiia bacterium]
MADIGIVGLGVMGENLALNFSDHGYVPAVYNRTTSRVDEFLAGVGSDSKAVGSHSLEGLIDQLSPPRKILVMVKAGSAVDAVVDALAPLLSPGDIVIDGGNSHYQDTIRRTAALGERGLHFIGMGVSGGEEGARHGPSIMPGGSTDAWPHVKEMLQDVAAKVPDGSPCCDWLGPDGSGHFVKMVHNGIEYGDMQVIAEAYQMMRDGLGMTHDEMASVFSDWNQGRLDSFLVEITAEILRFRDEDGAPLVEKILDSAGQKGTGRWTVEAALGLGMAPTLVAEAVFSRNVSALVNERAAASKTLAGPHFGVSGDQSLFVDAIRDALYASKITSYAQGFMVLKAASEEHGWHLDYGRTALLWRAGAIIRAGFLDDIAAAYRNSPSLDNLLTDPFFSEQLASAQDGWRWVVSEAVRAGIPVPAYSTALAFYDAYRSDRLPASLIQAQRDFFGAHTYERIDAARGEFFHTDWTGSGGATTAGAYEA